MYYIYPEIHLEIRRQEKIGIKYIIDLLLYKSSQQVANYPNKRDKSKINL